MTPWCFGRRVSFSFLLAVVLAIAGSACSSGAASGDTDKVQIAISRFDVTVINAAGRALVDAKVEILPVGHATSYSTHVPRIENGEKRAITFTQFSDSSGITFSPRTARPHAVAVTAKDIEGRELHVEVPWKQ
jgi:hypothetical protein